MLLRTKIVLSITLMVTVLAAAFSYLYISQILNQQVVTAHDTAAYLGAQLAYVAADAVPDLTSTRTNTSKPEAVKQATVFAQKAGTHIGPVVDASQLDGKR